MVEIEPSDFSARPQATSYILFQLSHIIYCHSSHLDSSHRYSFLDLYRGLIVIFMLEGHLVRELLGASWQSSPAFQVHEIFHGLTAPGFLFGAGFTFAIATQRKAHLLGGFSYPVLRRIWRGISLMLVGYALHLPYLSLAKTLSAATRSEWESFLLFDVLQLIGLCLVALRLLYSLFRKESAFLAATAISGFLLVLGTPLAWDSTAIRNGPLWLSTALTGWFQSPFPTFPYAAFVLGGVLASWGFLRAQRADQERLYMVRLLIAGALMTVGGMALDLLPVSAYERADFWYTAPSYFWMRLGLLLVALGGLWFLEHRVSGTSHQTFWMPRWITTLGVESLFVYIAHLLLLYGSVINPAYNMSAWLGRGLSPAVATLLVIPFVAVHAAGARWWRYAKKRHPYWILVVYWWMALTLVGEFLLRAY